MVKKYIGTEIAIFHLGVVVARFLQKKEIRYNLPLWRRLRFIYAYFVCYTMSKVVNIFNWLYTKLFQI